MDIYYADQAMSEYQMKIMSCTVGVPLNTGATSEQNN